MSITNISAAQYVSGKLRIGVQNGDLTDYNSGSRPSNFTHWIYPDKPRLTNLLKDRNNFPRVSVEHMDENTIKRLGIGSKQYHELTQLAINVWSPPTVVCQVANVATENHTFVTGTDDYELDNLPVSILGAAIDGTMGGGAYQFDRGTDYELIDADFDGFYDSVHWLGVDEPDNGTTFTCAYNRKASGYELCRIIAKDIHNYIRENWIDWVLADQELKNYKVVSSRPVTLDENYNINRYEMYVTFTGINIGNSI